MKIVVVVPTYNERDNIGPLLDALRETLASSACQPEFLVVDDASPDGTAAVVLERQARVPGIHLLSGRRTGLGAAYVRGLGYALEHLQPDVVIQMDADFSHAPQDVLQLVQAIEQGADLAIGSRYVGGGRTDEAWGWHRRGLSRCANLLARHWLGLSSVKDCTAGFRAWRAQTLRGVHEGNEPVRGYVFQVAMLRRAVAQGARVAEIPVEFPDRVHGESKLGWTDILEFGCWALLKGSLFRRNCAE